MIYVFISSDDLLLQEALDAHAGPLGPDDAVTRLDGAEINPEALLRACLTASFLGTRTVVLVRDLVKRFEGVAPGGGRARSKAAQLEAWFDAVGQLRHVPETTILAFLEHGPLRSNALLAALSGIAKVVELQPPGERGLVPWIEERARQKHVALAPDAALELARLVGPNPALLATEIDKLAVYAAGRTVAAEDVQALVGDVRETRVWDLTQAAVEGQADRATRALARLLDEGEAPLGLLALIAAELRRCALYLDLKSQRLSQNDIASRLRVGFGAVPHIARRAERLAGHLDGAYDAVLEADASIKRGALDDRTALYLLLHRVASLTRA